MRLSKVPMGLQGGQLARTLAVTVIRVFADPEPLR